MRKCIGNVLCDGIGIKYLYKISDGIGIKYLYKISDGIGIKYLDCSIITNRQKAGGRG